MLVRASMSNPLHHGRDALTEHARVLQRIRRRPRHRDDDSTESRHPRQRHAVVGPDDEGSYALIDPIGPGGVKSVEAADEVFATTLQGGKYHPWAAYRDPFAPQPNAPPGSGPYKPGAPSKPYGGGAR